MKRFALFIVALIPFTFACFAQAGPTHLGQSSYQHVILETGADLATFCSNDLSFYRVWPDGSRAAKPYMVPAGKFLMITDVVWTAVPPPTTFVQGQSEI